MLPTASASSCTIVLNSILLLCVCLLQLAPAQFSEDAGDLRIHVPELMAETRAVNPYVSLNALFLSALEAADDAGDATNNVNAAQRNNLIAAAAMPEIPAPMLRMQVNKNSGLRR